MTTLPPISAALEAEVRQRVRQLGVFLSFYKAGIRFWMRIDMLITEASAAHVPPERING